MRMLFFTYCTDFYMFWNSLKNDRQKGISILKGHPIIKFQSISVRIRSIFIYLCTIIKYLVFNGVKVVSM